MYRVYCDGNLLYHTKLSNLKIFDPSLELELNKTGSFAFSIYQDHPYYSTLQKLKSIVEVWQDDFLLFRGRVLDDEIGFYNEKTVSCEGELAFLLDSIQRPYDFTGGVAEFLQMLLDIHNAQVEPGKRFVLGNVTVTDPNDYIVRSDIDYVNTWEVIEKKLLELLGGFLIVRHVDGVAYLDYLAEITLLAPQKITFAKNLLDLKRIRKGGDIATVLIPLGAKIKDEAGQDTDKRLTIESVNGGVDFIIDFDAQAQFGTIVKTVIFDDVTDVENLKTKGQAQLSDLVKMLESIELTAADLATVDKDITSFHIGTQVDVSSDPHGMQDRFLVSKLSLKLLDPGANKLTLGKTLVSSGDAVKGISDSQQVLLQNVGKSAKTASDAVYNVERNLQASITASETSILSTVSETHYLKEDVDKIVSEVSNEVEQTQSGVEIRFTQFSQDIESLAAGTDAEFEEIRKFIRFVDGKILLGEVGNELELQIANDRISFLQDGAEVAYFSDRKLYVTDAQIMHSLQIGQFAFMPRANGNVSFKKM